MKVCTKCGEPREEECFGKTTSHGRSVRRAQCKDCQGKGQLVHRQANADKYALAQGRRNYSYKERNRSFIERFKDKPCMDCGNRFPSFVMEFDHVRGVKTATVATLAQSTRKLDRLREEIEKCDLVCANCHRVRTKNQGHYDRKTGSFGARTVDEGLDLFQQAASWLEYRMIQNDY